MLCHFVPQYEVVQILISSLKAERVLILSNLSDANEGFEFQATVNYD